MTVSVARIGGLAGFGFAAGVLMQNGVLLAGAPMPGAGLDQVIAFYEGHATRATLATAWVALNVPLLLVFVHAAGLRLESSSRSMMWGRVASGAAVVTSASFLVVTALQALLIARIGDLAQTPAVLALVWDFHSAAFGVVGPALGTLLAALALGSRHVALVPRPVASAALVGALLLVASGATTVFLVGGAPTIWLGMAGFLAWVVFLVNASWRMVRETEAARPMEPAGVAAP